MIPDDKVILIDKIKVLAADCKAENIELLPFGRVSEEFIKREDILNKIVELIDEYHEENKKWKHEPPARQ